MYIRCCKRGSNTSSEGINYVYPSFSGGQDNGMPLNACVKHVRQYGGRMEVLHMDYEVQHYSDYGNMWRGFASNRKVLGVYCCCVPFKVS